MHKNYRQRYLIAKTLTYICLVFSGLSFIFKAYSLNTPFIFIWFILGGAIIGIPACLAYYHYGVMVRMGASGRLEVATKMLAAAGNKRKKS